MINDLRLQNFRSHVDASFEFSPSVNIIVGPNASGKTNLLEAVLVAARGSSYRAKDKDLINFSSDWARLEAHSANSSRIVKLTREPAAKTFEINGKNYQKLSLVNSLSIVLFEPSHLNIVTGSPDLRRGYIDDLLEKTIIGYGLTRRRYKRALAQRNKLLKLGFKNAERQAFVWNLRLSQLSGQIVNERVKLSEKINHQLTKVYQQLSHSKTEINLSYQTQLKLTDYETSLLTYLENNLERDCLIGFTSAGPHRDDFKVTIAEKSVNETASRGEARSLTLALKIIELEILEKSRAAKPILLLDDVFSELDGARRHALTNHLKNYQTFITTTDADAVIEHFTETSKIVPLT